MSVDIMCKSSCHLIYDVLSGTGSILLVVIILTTSVWTENTTWAIRLQMFCILLISKVVCKPSLTRLWQHGSLFAPVDDILLLSVECWLLLITAVFKCQFIRLQDKSVPAVYAKRLLARSRIKNVMQVNNVALLAVVLISYRFLENPC